MGLSQFAINNAKPKGKPYLLSDGDGLHLRIHPKGGRQWRYWQLFDSGQAKNPSYHKFQRSEL